MTLGAGGTARWSYEIVFPGRGVHDLGAIAVRRRDRFGVRTWEHRHVDPKPLRVYPPIAPLRSLPRPASPRASIGDYVSSAFGEGIEPADIRRFAPGDRVRQVNWRASLRLGELYVTQHHRERNADVVLMLDTLAEVGRAPETTLDWSVRAAASLATAYLARKDRVGLINYGGLIHWVKPAGGRAQYERLVDALARAGGRLHLRGQGSRGGAAAGAAAAGRRHRDHAAARRALRPGRARPGRPRLRPGRPRRLARRRHARRAGPVAGHRPRLSALDARAPRADRRAAPAGDPRPRSGSLRSRSSWRWPARDAAGRAWSPPDDPPPPRRHRRGDRRGAGGGAGDDHARAAGRRDRARRTAPRDGGDRGALALAGHRGGGRLPGRLHGGALACRSRA